MAIADVSAFADGVYGRLRFCGIPFSLVRCERRRQVAFVLGDDSAYNSATKKANAVRVQSRLMTAVTALCGETPLGIAGALLQWLTLAILVVIGIPDIPLSWRLAVAPIGVVTLLAGVVFALRGGSLGPLIVIPAVFGVAMVVLLTIVCYPFRWFMASDNHAKP